MVLFVIIKVEKNILVALTINTNVKPHQSVALAVIALDGAVKVLVQVINACCMKAYIAVVAIINNP